MERRQLILAVDDEPDLRMVIERILSKSGYRVAVAGGVREALTLLDTLEDFPDLLVTDIRMPDGVGAQLAELVRRQRPGLPVLYVSGYPEDRARAESLIVDGFALEKPFRPAQLLGAVAEALSSRATH
jgi:CheY-like chemotaxis protein